MQQSQHGVLLQVLESGHRDSITCLVPHPNGELLSGSFDRVLKLWDTRRITQRGGSDVHQSFIGHSGAVTSAAAANGLVVTADAEDSLLFWRCQLPHTATAADAVDSSSTNHGSVNHSSEIHISGNHSNVNHSNGIHNSGIHSNGIHSSVNHSSAMMSPQGKDTAERYTAAERSIAPALGTNGFGPSSAAALGSRDVPTPECGDNVLDSMYPSENLLKPYIKGSAASEPARGAVPSSLAHSSAGTPACSAIIGLSTRYRNTALWLPPQGRLVYCVGNAVVVEDLQTRKQRFLVGSSSDVSALASPHPTSTVLASASSAAGYALVCELLPIHAASW